MRRRRKQEGGFALLVVFLLAATVAFTLYQELPRAAFESARDKEQVLMDRGNQYKRAIAIYYAVNKRFPAELKDLENTNQKRYLRRRYKDPMTGQDEWRLVHTNGSQLTDSLVQKPPTQNAGNGTPGAGPMVGGGPLGANNLNTAAATPDAPAIDPATGAPVQTMNAAALRRPSDRGFTPGGPAQSGAAPSSNPFNPNAAGAGFQNGANPAGFDPNDPRTWPPITLASAPNQNAQAQPGRQLPGQQAPGTQILPGQVPSGIPGQFPGLGGSNPQQAIGDFSNSANLPVSNPLQGDSQNYNPGGAAQGNPTGQGVTLGANLNQLFPQQPVPPGAQGNVPGAFPTPGIPQPAPPQSPNFIPAQPQSGLQGQGGNASIAAGATNPAMQAINNQLFSPAQTGGLQGAANGTQGGPGIAGVASKYKGPTIKSYRKRTKYQEWEFVFDPAAQNGQNAANMAGQNQLGQGLGQPGLNQNGPGQNGQAQPGLGQSGQTPNPFTSMFGSSPGQAPGQTPVAPTAQAPSP
jgi:hypothetical protein